jgi:hypothetical protein
MKRLTDAEMIAKIHNTARYFVEQRQVAWVLLAGTLLWGVFGFWRMPQRKDPEIPIREAVAIVPWPGMPAEKVELLVTKKAEEAIAQNAKVAEIRSVSRTGVAVIYAKLEDRVEETGKEFDDIKLKLDAIHDLPEGAGPVNFVKDFGDTAALMLTVASPRVDEAELDWRTSDIEKALAAARGSEKGRFSAVVCFPPQLDGAPLRRLAALIKREAETSGAASDLKIVEGSGFIALDGRSSLDDAQLYASLLKLADARTQGSEVHPDSWSPALVHDLDQLRSRLALVAGDKYSYRELDTMTEEIEKRLKTVVQVSKVNRSGLVEERVERDLGIGAQRRHQQPQHRAARRRCERRGPESAGCSKRRVPRHRRDWRSSCAELAGRNAGPHEGPGGDSARL